MSGKNESNDTLIRQWEMLRLIPGNNQRITTSELANRLEQLSYPVTIRTIQRDLQKLSCHFPITCDEESAKPGWYWAPKASLDIPNLSISDALSIKMMEDYLTPMLPQAILESLRSRFDQAEKRLESVNNPLNRWADKIRTVIPAQPLKSPTIAPGVLETIQNALINERQLLAQYQSRHGKPATEFILHPLALVQRGPVSYLVATAFSYEDIRLYALHRFECVSEQEDEIDIPADFDIDEYIAKGALSFGNGEMLDLVLRVSPDLKTILAESPLDDSMTITPDGDNFIITARVPDTWQLKWWIRSHGPNAEVLEPISLRQDFVSALQKTLALYEAT